MLALFHFLVDYQLWIYGILGVLALLYLTRLISAWRERYSTIFGLEREDAQRRLNSALAIFILLILLIGAEFVLITFVIPEWPLVMLTPTPENRSSEDDEFMITRPEEGGLSIISTPQGASASTAVSAAASGGCIPDQLEWLEPHNGDVIDGSYILRATVNVQDMAWYNWAYSLIEDQANWTTISAGTLPVLEGDLGLWATSQVPNGDYTLRLTVYGLDNRELKPCDVHIRVLNEED